MINPVYKNVATFNFKGIDVYADGREDVSQEHTTTVTADTWPEILSAFMFALRGAGYFPYREAVEDVLDQIFPTVEEYDCDSCGWEDEG